MENRSLNLRNAHDVPRPAEEGWMTRERTLGLVLVAATGWQRLDPLVALAVAAHILWAGIGLVRRSFRGLMDRALPAADRSDGGSSN